MATATIRDLKVVTISTISSGTTETGFDQPAPMSGTSDPADAPVHGQHRGLDRRADETDHQASKELPW
jgi:hypothetical protein